MKIPFFRTLRASDRYVIETLLDGRFHSGLSLSRDLDISRTAVWKIIQKIQKQAFPVEVHRRKGYRFIPSNDPPFEFLSEEKILEFLPAKLQEAFQIAIYQYSPREDWGTFFFSLQRPLTDFALCLLETQGNPPSGLGRYLHLAIAIDRPLTHPVELVERMLKEKLTVLFPLQKKRVIYSPALGAQKLTLIQLSMACDTLNQDRNFLTATVTQEILNLLYPNWG
jgi:biotin operon repressor BirA-like protein